MSWVQILKGSIGQGDYSFEFAPDIVFNLEELFTFTVLERDQVEGCALAAAVASGNYNLWNTMYSNPYSSTNQGFLINNSSTNAVERLAGVRAGVLAAQNNVYFNYADTFEPLKGISEHLRNYIYATSGGTTKDRFDSYMLAGSLVGPCNICITSYTTMLKKESAYNIEQFRDIGRIAAVIKAVSTMYPAYIPPPPQEQYTGI